MPELNGPHQMHFKALPLEINKEAPFANDALERQTAIESLTAFLGRVKTPFVLAVNSPWGTGKTTFVRMWRGYLENQGYRCLYLDVWKTDFLGDPLVGLLSELGSLPSDNKKFKKAMGFAKKFGTALLKQAIPIVGKVVSEGTVDVADLQADLVNEFTNKKLLIEKFREELTKAVNEIREHEANKPLVVIIDELDRCRPNFAVEVLERVKHIFNIEGIFFVVAIDKSHLGESVKAIYGAGLNSDEYLRKFFDVEFLISEPKPELFTKSLTTRFSLDEFFQKRQGRLRDDKDTFMTIFQDLAQLWGLNLRAQEQCFTFIKIALMMTKDNQHLFPIPLTALIVLKVAKQEAYREYVASRGDVQNIIACVRSAFNGENFLKSRSGVALEAFLLAISPTLPQNQRLIEGHRTIMNNQSEPDENRVRSKNVVQLMERLSSPFEGNPSLQYLVSKIELAFSFQR
jgi:hypothetical protein